MIVVLLWAQLFRLRGDFTPFLDAMKYMDTSRNSARNDGLARTTNTATPPIPNFRFPDVDFRTRYYMGSWYDRNLSAKDLNCEVFRDIDPKFTFLLHDKDILYTYDALANQVRSNEHWNVALYLKFYLKILERSRVTSSSIVAVHVGDSSSTNAQVPVAAKTRRAGFHLETLKVNSTSPGNVTKQYFPIIWPLNMGRHFGPIDVYLQLLNTSSVTAWEDKKEAIIWRGGYTGIPALNSGRGFRSPSHIHGPRVQAVRANCHRNVARIDVAFHDIPKKAGIPKKIKELLQKQCVRRSHSTMQEQLEYKYILNVEGNDVSSGLKWQLASNSVVFMAKPRTVSFAMEDLLVPFYHYVPVNDDYTNLEEMLEWAIKHDDEAKKIAEQSTQYMNDLWISEKAQQEYERIQNNLALKYQQQFASALWSCLPKEKRNKANWR